MTSKQELPEHLRYKWQEAEDRKNDLTKAGNDLEARKLSQENLDSNEKTVNTGMKGPTPLSETKNEEVVKDDFEFIPEQELEQQNNQANEPDMSITVSPLSLLDDLAVAFQNEQDISQLFSKEELEMAQEALQENAEMIPNDQAIILAGVNFKKAIDETDNDLGKDDLYKERQDDVGKELEDSNSPDSPSVAHEETQSETNSNSEPETQRSRPLPTPYDRMRR